MQLADLLRVYAKRLGITPRIRPDYFGGSNDEFDLAFGSSSGTEVLKVQRFSPLFKYDVAFTDDPSDPGEPDYLIIEFQYGNILDIATQLAGSQDQFCRKRAATQFLDTHHNTWGSRTPTATHYLDFWGVGQESYQAFLGCLEPRLDLNHKP